MTINFGDTEVDTFVISNRPSVEKDPTEIDLLGDSQEYDEPYSSWEDYLFDDSEEEEPKKRVRGATDLYYPRQSVRGQSNLPIHLPASTWSSADVYPQPKQFPKTPRRQVFRSTYSERVCSNHNAMNTMLAFRNDDNLQEIMQKRKAGLKELGYHLLEKREDFAMWNRSQAALEKKIRKKKFEEIEKVLISVMNMDSFARNFGPSPLRKSVFNDDTILPVSPTLSSPSRKSTRMSTFTGVGLSPEGRKSMKSISWMGQEDPAILIPNFSPISPTQRRRSTFNAEQGKESEPKKKRTVNFDKKCKNEMITKLRRKAINLIRKDTSNTGGRRSRFRLLVPTDPIVKLIQEFYDKLSLNEEDTLSEAHQKELIVLLGIAGLSAEEKAMSHSILMANKEIPMTREVLFYDLVPEIRQRHKEARRPTLASFFHPSEKTILAQQDQIAKKRLTEHKTVYGVDLESKELKVPRKTQVITPMDIEVDTLLSYEDVEGIYSKFRFIDDLPDDVINLCDLFEPDDPNAVTFEEFEELIAKHKEVVARWKYQEEEGIKSLYPYPDSKILHLFDTFSMELVDLKRSFDDYKMKYCDEEERPFRVSDAFKVFAKKNLLRPYPGAEKEEMDSLFERKEDRQELPRGFVDFLDILHTVREKLKTNVRQDFLRLDRNGTGLLPLKQVSLLLQDLNLSPKNRFEQYGFRILMHQMETSMKDCYTFDEYCRLHFRCMSLVEHMRRSEEKMNSANVDSNTIVDAVKSLSNIKSKVSRSTTFGMGK